MTVETKSAVAEASSQAQVNTEPSMAEYASQREAEMRGQQYQPKTNPAEVVVVDESAASTESEVIPAEATEEENKDNKTTTESATEEDIQIEEAHPAKKGIQKRFDELTAKRVEAERVAEERKIAFEELEAKYKRVEEDLAAKALEVITPVVPKIEDDPLPVRDDFDDPDEYTAAFSAHAVRSELRKANEAAESNAQEARNELARKNEETRLAQVQSQIETLHKNFNENVKLDAADYPDYEEKVTNNADIKMRNDVFFAIEQSKMPGHILYHLANNPADLEEIQKMNPNQVAMRIGELQAEIRIARKPKPTQAAVPVKPVGQRTSPSRKSPDEESMAEYAARRDKEIQQEAALKYPKRAGNR